MIQVCCINNYFSLLIFSCALHPQWSLSLNQEEELSRSVKVLNFLLLPQPLLAAPAGQTLVFDTSVLTNHTAMKIPDFIRFVSFSYDVIMIMKLSPS